jgi:hypothetical protein
VEARKRRGGRVYSIAAGANVASRRCVGVNGVITTTIRGIWSEGVLSEV